MFYFSKGFEKWLCLMKCLIVLFLILFFETLRNRKPFSELCVLLLQIN